MGKDINNDNSFWIRLRSSVILTVITLATIIAGGYVTYGVLLAITLIGLTELYKTVGVNKKPAAFVGYGIAVIWYAINLPCLSEYIPAFISDNRLAVTVALFLTVLLSFYVFAFPKYDSEQITMIFFGFFYVVLTLMYIYLVRVGKCGAYTVWLIFLGSWGSDTSAYLVGRKLGRHKIAKVLSPKKSLEGCIGGVVGASLLGAVYAFIFRDRLVAEFANPVLAFAIVCAVSGFVSMIGDMAASGIKRNKQIKDYGKLIPGHGGILDRFDSVIFIAPIVYYLLALVG